MNGEGFREDAEKAHGSGQDGYQARKGMEKNRKKERSVGVMQMESLVSYSGGGQHWHKKNDERRGEEKKSSNTAETGEETFTHRATRTAGSS